jgi:hypothetical protein
MVRILLQAVCDTGLATPGIHQIRGASFVAAVRSFVLTIPYQRFVDHVNLLGAAQVSDFVLS